MKVRFEYDWIWSLPLRSPSSSWIILKTWGGLGDEGDVGDLGDLGDVGDLEDVGDSGDVGGLRDSGDLGELGDMGDLEDLGNLGACSERRRCWARKSTLKATHDEPQNRQTA